MGTAFISPMTQCHRGAPLISKPACNASTEPAPEVSSPGAGAVLSSTEMMIFELLNRAGTKEFRALLPLLKRLQSSSTRLNT